MKQVCCVTNKFNKDLLNCRRISWIHLFIYFC